VLKSLGRPLAGLILAPADTFMVGAKEVTSVPKGTSAVMLVPEIAAFTTGFKDSKEKEVMFASVLVGIPSSSFLQAEKKTSEDNSSVANGKIDFFMISRIDEC
jgi:hypothetical protein